MNKRMREEGIWEGNGEGKVRKRSLVDMERVRGKNMQGRDK